MKLLVTTPTSVVVDVSDVASIRAEDETGAFGLLPHHADFLTVLSVSVLSWRDTDGIECYVAVRGGILTVRDGETVEVATREAVQGDDLDTLEAEALTRFEAEYALEEEARTTLTRLHLAALRQISRYIRAERPPLRPDSFNVP